MLKLESKGGKFDIVLSEASLQGVGNSSKKSIKSLSSAGRRKTKELKSKNVLPTQKEVSPRQVVKTRISKPKDVPKREDDVQEIRAVNAAATKPAGSQHHVRNIVQENANAVRSKPKAKSSATSNQTKRKKSNEVPGAVTQHDFKNTGVISQGQLASIMEALKQGDTSVLATIAPQPTQENQNRVAADFSNKRNETKNISSKIPLNSTEPMFVPGLDLGSSVNEEEGRFMPKSDAQSVDTVSVTSRNELQTISYSTTPAQGKASSYTSPSSSRPDPVAMRSSFAIGAPGQVAYDYNQAKRDKNKQYLADLERQIQLKKQMPLSDKERFIKAMEDPSSQPMTSRQQVKNPPAAPTQRETVSVTQGRYGAESVGQPEANERSTVSSEQNEQMHALGGRQVKNQFELDEIERKRIKHLEHQRAVQEQVEEKRRLKMEERDRKYREEKEEEAKLAKEREFLALQFEEESRKRQEKEEAEKQRQIALQNSVLEAYESAKQEKQNAILLKLKAGGHDISHLHHGEQNPVDATSVPATSSVDQELNRHHLPPESIEMPQQFSSRSDKGFRPILNLTDDTYEEKKKQSNTKQLTKESNKQKSNKLMKSEEITASDKIRKHSDARRKQDSKVNIEVNKHRASIESKKSSQTTAEILREKRSKKVVKPNSRELKIKSTRDKDEKPIKEKAKKQIVENAKRPLKKSKAVDEPSHEILSVHDDVVEELEIEADDFAYKRSSTVTLQGQESTDSFQDTGLSEQKYPQQEYTNWDSWGVPTSRQQQILDQLQTLRKGLMDKKKEYERGTTPSNSLFH